MNRRSLRTLLLTGLQRVHGKKPLPIGGRLRQGLPLVGENRPAFFRTINEDHNGMRVRQRAKFSAFILSLGLTLGMPGQAWHAGLEDWESIARAALLRGELEAARQQAETALNNSGGSSRSP